jgi:hypothetical protein
MGGSCGKFLGNCKQETGKQMKKLTFHISKKQCFDSGMALVLLLALLAFFMEDIRYIPAIALVAALSLLIPWAMYPFALLWMNFAFLLGIVSSNLLLSLVFFLVVFPMGLIRRISGKDSLHLRKFKKSSASVFINRNQSFKLKDLESLF